MAVVQGATRANITTAPTMQSQNATIHRPNTHLRLAFGGTFASPPLTELVAGLIAVIRTEMLLADLHRHDYGRRMIANVRATTSDGAIDCFSLSGEYPPRLGVRSLPAV
jgi:hypothetical protein